MGIKMESGESISGVASGVVKARGFRRKPEEGGRCSSGGVDGCNGAPWEPYPGAGGGCEITSKVRLPVNDGRITIVIEDKGECAPRRMRIAKKDVEKFGFTVGCAGCRAANLDTG